MTLAFLGVSLLFGAASGSAQQHAQAESEEPARLNYEVKGSGPALLLLHGGLMDLGMWDRQAAEFQREYRVIRPDLPGFGKSEPPSGPYSPAEEVRRLLDALDVERAHVLGLSMGGAIAIDFALTYPERVTSLVLAEPGLAGWPFSAEVMQSMGRVIAAMQAGDREGAIQAMLDTPAFAYAREHNPAASAEIEGFVRANFRGLRTQQQMNFQVPNAAGGLGDISAPTLLLLSEGAGEDALAIADRIEASVRQTERVVIRGAGHMMNLERPDAFNEAVLHFLRRQ